MKLGDTLVVLDDRDLRARLAQSDAELNVLLASVGTSGRIGQAMARRGTGFNMRLLAFDVAPDRAAERLGIKFVSLDELLVESDFLSLHAALTPQNRGLLGETQLRKMKPDGFSYLLR